MGLTKREVKYDYLRTLAVFAIIMVHAVPAETLNFKQWLFSAALSPVLLAFVGIYFMLSGLFLLKSGTEDIPGFYWSRFQTIVLPFVCYSGIYYWYFDIYLGVEPLRWQEHLAAFGKGLFTGTIPMTPHLWFMYVIMALYLCAPFFGPYDEGHERQGIKTVSCTYGGYPGNLHLSSGFGPGCGRGLSIYDI